MWSELSSYLKEQPFALEGRRQCSQEKREHFLTSLPGTCSRTTATLGGQNPLFLLHEFINEPSTESWEEVGDVESGNRRENRKENKACV